MSAPFSVFLSKNKFITTYPALFNMRIAEIRRIVVQLEDSKLAVTLILKERNLLNMSSKLLCTSCILLRHIHPTHNHQSHAPRPKNKKCVMTAVTRHHALLLQAYLDARSPCTFAEGRVRRVSGQREGQKACRIWSRTSKNVL